MDEETVSCVSCFSVSDASINPRDYESYDDYRAAMEEEEWQEDQKDDPDGSKAEEAQLRLEIWARFYKEGRTPRCIPSCRKPLCLERECCVWYELQIIQELSREWYFGDEWSDEYLLVFSNSVEEHTKRGLCSVLPAIWQKQNSYENRVLRFFMDVWDLTSLEQRSNPLSAFCRDVYFFTLETLREVPWSDRDRGIKRMEHFLESNTTLPKMAWVMLSIPKPY